MESPSFGRWSLRLRPAVAVPTGHALRHDANGADGPALDDCSPPFAIPPWPRHGAGHPLCGECDRRPGPAAPGFTRQTGGGASLKSSLRKLRTASRSAGFAPLTALGQRWPRIGCSRRGLRSSPFGARRSCSRRRLQDEHDRVLPARFRHVRPAAYAQTVDQTPGSRRAKSRVEKENTVMRRGA